MPFVFTVTPHDYQPPGFKESRSSNLLLFDGEPVSVQVGFVSSGFHSMKIKVTTEATRMHNLENNQSYKSNTTEIVHQGLDCEEEDEEEEEDNDQVRQSFNDLPIFYLIPLAFFTSYKGHVMVAVSIGACQVYKLKSNSSC